MTGKEGLHPPFILCTLGGHEFLHSPLFTGEAEGCFCLWVYTEVFRGQFAAKTHLIYSTHCFPQALGLISKPVQ